MKVGSSASAFSLIELLIVVSILNILASIFIPVYHTAVAKASVVNCLSEIDIIRKTEEMYMSENGRYESDLNKVIFAEGYDVNMIKDYCIVLPPADNRKLVVAEDGSSWYADLTPPGKWKDKCILHATNEETTYEGPCKKP